MNGFIASPIFGIILTVLAYNIGLILQRKVKYSLLNPVLTSSVMIGLLLLLLRIPYDTYAVGGKGISFFLGPLTVSLALPLYRQRQILVRNSFPLMLGICAGVVVSSLSVIGCARIFDFDRDVFVSLLPKSLTNPMAVALSEILGGNTSLTVAFVVATGIFGMLAAPLVFKVLGITNDIAKGAGLGTASHAIGTAKAFEYSEEAGSISSVCIGLTGLVTVLFISKFSEVISTYL